MREGQISYIFIRFLNTHCYALLMVYMLAVELNARGLS